MHSHGPGGGLPPPPTRLQSDTHAYHKPGGRLPLLSARPAVTFPAIRHHHPQASTKLYCLVTEAHRCEKLAHSFYAVVPGRDSNPRPLDRESDTLPQHHDAPKRGLKKAKRPFSLYHRKSLEESLLQSFDCENCQRQSCRAFIGLTIDAKIIGGGRPLLPEILG